MRRRVRALFSRLYLLGLGVLGCQGSIRTDTPSLDPETGLPVDPATGRPIDPNTGAPLPPFSAAPVSMRRLTSSQYRNVTRDLLGSVELRTELETDTAVNGFVEIGAGLSTISPAAAEKFENAAFELGKQAASPALRDGLLGCKPKATVDSACTRSFIERFGRRAFRRPLSSDELIRYVGIAEQSAQKLGDFYGGVEFVVAGLLESPNFLFRVEVGEADPDQPPRLRYSGFEMATRLSFLLWNTAPDDALLDAAAAGQLVTTKGLSEQAERLLADPRARTAMNNFEFERLGLEALDELAKDKGVFAAFTPGLLTGMREDILRTIDYVAFEQRGDIRDLFETEVSFVNGELAGLYGVKKPASAVELALLPRGGLRLGLLGKPGLLAMNAHVRDTSPTLRGKFVRERLLCQTIQAPPPNVITILPEPNPNAATMRERLAVHRSNPTCAGCHGAMDPIGLAFENFDAIGAFRATDNGHALDVSGDIDGHAFAGPAELGSILKNDPRVVECGVRQLYRYATGHVELEGEEIIVKSLAQRFASAGHRMAELLKAVVVSDGFRYMKRGEP
jgi:hypothetical protein